MEVRLIILKVRTEATNCRRFASFPMNCELHRQKVYNSLYTIANEVHQWEGHSPSSGASTGASVLSHRPAGLEASATNGPKTWGIMLAGTLAGMLAMLASMCKAMDEVCCVGL